MSIAEYLQAIICGCRRRRFCLRGNDLARDAVLGTEHYRLNAGDRQIVYAFAAGRKFTAKTYSPQMTSRAADRQHPRR